MSRQVVTLGLIALASACGSGATDVHTSGAIHFEGVEATVFEWHNFAVPDGAGLSEAIPVQVREIVIGDTPGYCASFAAHRYRPATGTITISLTRRETAPLRPGRYALGVVGADPIEDAELSYLRTDASCSPVGSASATGTVQLDRVEEQRVSGSIDAILRDGTRVSGPFDATGCVADQPGFAPGPDGGITVVPEFRCGAG